MDTRDRGLLARSLEPRQVRHGDVPFRAGDDVSYVTFPVERAIVTLRDGRTVETATVKRYHYESHDELRQHLQLFVDAYNYGRRLKTLYGLTPYEFVCQAWTKQLERFRFDPSHHTAGPNI